MNMIKPPVMREKAEQRRTCVAMNFDSLALWANTGPLSDVSVHCRSQLPGGDEPMCGTDTRMRQTV